jgi:hypothetical protein
MLVLLLVAVVHFLCHTHTPSPPHFPQSAVKSSTVLIIGLHTQ